MYKEIKDEKRRALQLFVREIEVCSKKSTRAICPPHRPLFFSNMCSKPASVKLKQPRTVTSAVSVTGAGASRVDDLKNIVII